jgi:hypothetical protein
MFTVCTVAMWQWCPRFIFGQCLVWILDHIISYLDWMRFNIFTAVSVKSIVFFAVMPWIQRSLVLTHWYVRGKYCLQLEGHKVNQASNEPTRRKQEMELLDGCLLGLFFSYEDGRSMFLQNVSGRHRPWYSSSGLMSWWFCLQRNIAILLNCSKLYSLN